VAVAFGAPVGGLLLAIEEGASFLSSGIFWRGFLATCTGVLALQALAQCHTAGGALLQTKFGVWRDLGRAPLPRGRHPAAPKAPGQSCRHARQLSSFSSSVPMAPRTIAHAHTNGGARRPVRRMAQLHARGNKPEP